jgi:nucleoside-diphosphate-sugar epimerase
VVGASGFIGRQLEAVLRATGIDVKAISSKDIDLTADATDQQLSAELTSGDSLVFLSAITPDKGRSVDAFLANLKMGQAVRSAIEASPPAHIVYIGSDAVYPFKVALVSEKSLAEPTDLYGAMHLSREIMFRQNAQVPTAILRPTLVYGSEDTHNSYGPNRLRRMAQSDRRIKLFGNGEETRDHIYVGDVAELIRRVLCHKSQGLLNLATGRSISYRDLADKIAVLCDGKIQIQLTPRQNPITYRSFDISNLRAAFPEFRFTQMDEGLQRSHQGEFD